MAEKATETPLMKQYYSFKAKYPDAFIIAFKGEEKIPVSEAVKLVK